MDLIEYPLRSRFEGGADRVRGRSLQRVGETTTSGGTAGSMSITDIRQVLGDGTGGQPVPRVIERRPNTFDRWVYRGGVRVVALSTLLVLFLIGFFLFYRGLPAFQITGIRTSSPIPGSRPSRRGPALLSSGSGAR